ncbi:hypothetical protein [Pectobacterium parvum]|uniref:hypothetical protein n=1 Tax=Pectobacterium parvum TaxID=2778550 RepID=UPI003CCA4AA3
MKAHQTGTFALWLLRVLNDCDQPVSSGWGTLNLALCRTRLIVPDRVEVNINERNTREHHHHDCHPYPVSIRIEDSTPLLPSSAPSVRDLNHSSMMMATKGRTNTPLETSTAQMPLWTTQLTRVR